MINTLIEKWFLAYALAVAFLLLVLASGVCLWRQQHRAEASQFIEVVDNRGQPWLIKTDDVKCVVPSLVSTNLSQIFLNNGLVVNVGQQDRAKIVFKMFKP